MRSRLILAAAAVALHLLPLWRNTPHPLGDPKFAIPQSATTPPSVESKDMREELINPSGGNVMAHVASLCELPGGKLAAAWYGGTREGHKDVAIYFSIRSPIDAADWSPPRAVVTRESAARELQRFVRKVGNAVIFADSGGGLWLVYVSVAAGGWSGSSLNYKRSSDEGRTWTPSRRLTLSPYCNISELVKNKPIFLEDGNWVLPIYHEAFCKFPELLWLRETAGTVSVLKSRLFGGRTAFQPSVVALSSHDAMALCRPADGSRKIAVSRTTDAGKTWTAPQPTDLPNPDAGMDALRLSDGRLLLAFNDASSGRENLRLALSSNNGHTWNRVATLEEEAGEEFSYPFLLQAGDGRVHLIYTWKRKGIKHRSFTLGWLNSQGAILTP